MTEENPPVVSKAEGAAAAISSPVTVSHKSGAPHRTVRLHGRNRYPPVPRDQKLVPNMSEMAIPGPAHTQVQNQTSEDEDDTNRRHLIRHVRSYFVHSPPRIMDAIIKLTHSFVGQYIFCRSRPVCDLCPSHFETAAGLGDSRVPRRGHRSSPQDFEASVLRSPTAARRPFDSAHVSSSI
jgi:hypothetical protein